MHREIANMWQDEGFIPSGDPNDEQGVRRGLWREYEDNVDWTDPVQVERVLRVYETLLTALTDEALDAARTFLERYGFKLGNDSRLKLPTPLPLSLPRSLVGLRDPAAILDSFERIDRALPQDPAQAIGSAKELIEATAKTVLVEIGITFDEKTIKFPALVDLAQRELRLHPQQAAGPDGSSSVKRVLGGLMTVALGVNELRNEGWGTGHGRADARQGLHARHAHLAVGAARTWCQLLLDTLTDPNAPWRKSAVDSVMQDAGHAVELPSAPEIGEHGHRH
ncbi:abortive infection family protein [Solwaraspora sp. WMMA2101]|uniref:abortive infection family protein n=1 Tax=Solwaraspora sp. WMMA2101 TaxID=3404124 RepID=UPI003B926B7C